MSGAAAGVVTASIYSGRPDPEWAIDDARLESLRRIWDGLASSGTGPPQPPPLGYRGCSLRAASGDEWLAYGGVATHRRGNGPPEHRSDSGRRFEKALLETAPRGVLPDGLVRS